MEVCGDDVRLMSVLTGNFYLYSSIHRSPYGLDSGLNINMACKPVFRLICFLEQEWQTFFLFPAVGSYRVLPANAGRSIVAVVDVLRLHCILLVFKFLSCDL